MANYYQKQKNEGIQESNVNEWRTQLASGFRQETINKIMELLERHLAEPSPEVVVQVKQIAEAFEEKVFSAARSQDDYILQVKLHLLNLEYKPHSIGEVKLSASTSACGIQNSPDPVAPQGPQSQLDEEAESTSRPLSHSSQSKEHMSCHLMQSLSAGVQTFSSSSVTSSAMAQTETTLLIDVGQSHNVQNMPENLVDCLASQCVHSDVLLDPELIKGQKHTQQIVDQQQSKNVQNKLQNQIPMQTHFENNHLPLTQSQVCHSQKQHNSVQAIQVQLQSPHHVKALQSHQSSPPSLQQIQTSLMQSSPDSDNRRDQESSFPKRTSHFLYQHPQSTLQCHKQNSPVNQQSLSPVHQNQQLIECFDEANIQQNWLFRNPTGDMQREHHLSVQQNDINNFQQQPLGSQRNMFGFLQHPVETVQQAKILEQHKAQQASSISFLTQEQQSQSEQLQLNNQTLFQQLVESPIKSNSLQRDMFQMHASTSLLQTQNTIEHQKQLFRFQRRPSEASTANDSFAARRQKKVVDQQEVVLQKIKSLKEVYMPLLVGAYKNIKIPETTNSRQVDQYQKCRSWLEGVLKMFDRFPANIPPDLTEEKLLPIERQIFDFIKMNRAKRNFFSQQKLQKKLLTRSAQSSRSQIPHLQHCDNHMNTMMQSRNLKIHGMTMQSNIVVSSNYNSQNDTNLLQPGINYLQPNSNVLLEQHMKQQFQKQHLHHPFVQQQLEQQIAQQQYQQTVLQQNHQQMIQQSRQLAYNKQYPLVAGALSYTSSLRPFQASSPHATQHSSPQINQQNMTSLSLIKSRVSSPLVSSPSFPLSPSISMSLPPMKIDNEKSTWSISLHSTVGNGVENKTASSETQPQALVSGTHGISSAPIVDELANPDNNKSPATAVNSDRTSGPLKPIERLIDVVESMSCKALRASVIDIERVVSMIDTIAGSMPGNQHKATLGEDLVATAKQHMLVKNLLSRDGIVIAKKMKYSNGMPVSVVALEDSVNNNYKPYIAKETTDLESTATSRIKRPRIEVNQALLKEIKDINQQLVNTVVDIMEEADRFTSLSDVTRGTIVKCSYTSLNISQQQTFPELQMHLLVSSNYPNCSPGLLDKCPLEMSEKRDDLLHKARLLFSRSLRCLSQPVSLKEMVKSWDTCARGVILEHAVQNGGGSFSTKYGAWQTL